MSQTTQAVADSYPFPYPDCLTLLLLKDNKRKEEEEEENAFWWLKMTNARETEWWVRYWIWSRVKFVMHRTQAEENRNTVCRVDVVGEGTAERERKTLVGKRYSDMLFEWPISQHKHTAAEHSTRTTSSQDFYYQIKILQITNHYQSILVQISYSFLFEIGTEYTNIKSAYFHAHTYPLFMKEKVKRNLVKY